MRKQHPTTTHRALRTALVGLQQARGWWPRRWMSGGQSAALDSQIREVKDALIKLGDAVDGGNNPLADE